MNLKKLIKHLFVWRLLLVGAAAIGIQILPFKDSFPYRETILEPFGHPLFYSWANFDGVHYLGIAKDGYWAQFTQAFFPLYPFLIDWTNVILGNHLLTGLIITHIALIAALYLLHRLICLDHKPNIANSTILLLLVFPTSFYFGSLYTESIFLFFVTASFYAIRKQNFTLSILAAALASATRIIGVFLLPALLYERWTQLKSQHKKLTPTIIFKNLAPFSLSISGLLAYMYYLHTHFSDALYFLTAQPAFGAQRSADKLILLYQVIFRYTKMIFTVDPTSILYYTVTQEFIFSLIFLVLSIWAFKKVRPSYAIFGLLSYITPTLTGTFSSMPRYVLLLFPAFITLSLVTNPHHRRWIIRVSVILLLINTILFTRGYWVA